MALVKTNHIDELPDDELEQFYASDEGIDYVVCKSPEKLNRLISHLSPQKSVHFISDGDWSSHDLIMQLLRRYKPAELFITTYAIREFPVRQLILAQEANELTSVTMLIDYRAKVRTPEVFHLASLNVQRIFLTSIHAKVMVLRSAAGCVSIVGSANLTQNPRIEAGVISLDPELAKFHINWIEKVMENAEIFE